MELTPQFFALAAPAVLFAGVSKGGFGSGAAFASASILALALDPGTALGLMLPLLMLIDLVTLRPYWRQWDWRASRVLILGSLPGVAMGALVYAATDDNVIRLMLGVMSLVYVASQARRLVRDPAPRRRHLPGWLGLVAGCTAGFTSFVSHAGGPPAAVYMLSLGLSKTAYQASSVLVFWAINIFKAVPYGMLGIFTAQTLTADLLLAPFALFGAWAGVRLHRMISERAFFAVTFALLTATGTKLIWDALT